MNTNKFSYIRLSFLILGFLLGLSLAHAEAPLFSELNAVTIDTHPYLLASKAPLAVADLDGDDKQDLVTASYNGVLVAYTGLNPSSPTLVEYPCGDSIHALTLSDLDADDDLDIVAIGSDLHVLNNDSARAFSVETFEANNTILFDVTSGDINKNNKPDIFVSMLTPNHENYVLGFEWGTSLSFQFKTAGYPYSLDLANKNLLISQLMMPEGSTSVDGVAVLNKDGYKEIPFYNAPYAEPVAVKSVDLDGDGTLEIITANASNDTFSTVSITSSTLEHTPLGPGAIPFNIAAADFNLKGQGLAFANYGRNSVSVFLNDGNGELSFDGEIAVGAGPQAIAAVDMNADNCSDIITVDNISSTLSIIYNQNSGCLE